MLSGTDFSAENSTRERADSYCELHWYFECVVKGWSFLRVSGSESSHWMWILARCLTCAPKKYTLKKSSLTWGTPGGPIKGLPRNSAAILYYFDYYPMDDVPIIMYPENLLCNVGAVKISQVWYSTSDLRLLKPMQSSSSRLSQILPSSHPFRKSLDIFLLVWGIRVS